MAKIVRIYCNSDIVLRGRIQTIKISNLELSTSSVGTSLRQGQIKKGLANSSVIKSLYVRIAKRDRKFLKGGRLIANLGSTFFAENRQMSSYEEEEESENENDLDIYLMSQAMLKLSEELNDARKIRSENVSISKGNNNPDHCVCDKLKRTSRRINTKYLLLANVLRTRSLVEKRHHGASNVISRHRLRLRHQNQPAFRYFS